jgi:phosphoribosylamine--glycine ligase
VTFRNESSVCKYIVPEGYGSNPRKDATLIVNPGYAQTASLYYAAVNQIDGQITTTSSRAAAIVSSSSTLAEAEKECERGLEFITGDNIYVRHDIAKPDLINKRIKNMENIR